jgi:hypothetical protein
MNHFGKLQFALYLNKVAEDVNPSVATMLQGSATPPKHHTVDESGALLAHTNGSSKIPMTETEKVAGALAVIPELENLGRMGGGEAFAKAKQVHDAGSWKAIWQKLQQRMAGAKAKATGFGTAVNDKANYLDHIDAGLAGSLGGMAAGAFAPQTTIPKNTSPKDLDGVLTKVAPRAAAESAGNLVGGGLGALSSLLLPAKFRNLGAILGGAAGQTLTHNAMGPIDWGKKAGWNPPPADAADQFSNLRQLADLVPSLNAHPDKLAPARDVLNDQSFTVPKPVARGAAGAGLGALGGQALMSLLTPSITPDMSEGDASSIRHKRHIGAGLGGALGLYLASRKDLAGSNAVANLRQQFAA